MTTIAPIDGLRNAEPMKLVASGIVMEFGGLKALDKVDFMVPHGGAVGLLGQNGSGKTTLLNVLTGTLRPQFGTVTFNGRSMLGQPPNEFAKAGVARVFQSVQVFPRLTVLENLYVARLGHNKRKPLSEGNASDILERMQLGAFANDLARDISYGHQRLLEIAMALAASAELILLDEPTAGLGPALVESVVLCLRDLNVAGVSLVLIEHETEVVFKVCDQVWVLNEGRVIACGTPAEIRDNRQVLDLYLGAPTSC
jgi:branched-chain amino acid transport system permease protein